MDTRAPSPAKCARISVSLATRVKSSPSVMQNTLVSTCAPSVVQNTWVSTCVLSEMHSLEREQAMPEFVQFLGQ